MPAAVVALERLAAFTRAANARRRVIVGRSKPMQPADVVKPADQQQHHTKRPDQGRGMGRDRLGMATGQGVADL
jgi:non-ribosomal peptide synthetase component E (peptide arylation enzyme)